jgi:hypothetical protein
MMTLVKNSAVLLVVEQVCACKLHSICHDKARGEDPVHNFTVNQNFIARACVDIKSGEELFLYYALEGEKECKCIGCQVLDRDHSFVLE